MKFSRSNFKMQRFESRSPRLESWRTSIRNAEVRIPPPQPASQFITHTELGRRLKCSGSNPAAPARQSVSNASHMKIAPGFDFR
jgi:hypothetical protein